jgi:hypothetical protein
MKENEQDKHDEIENFLDGKLSEEEKILFYTKLETDTKFKTLYQQRIALAESWGKAKKYEKTYLEISGVIRTQKLKNRNTRYLWSIAASVTLLISIASVVMFSNHKRDLEFANNSKGSETYANPKMNQIEEKASLYIIGKLDLISPILDQSYSYSDSITFRWHADSNTESFLVIISRSNGKQVYKHKLKISAKQFVLKEGILQTDQYEWFIEGFPAKGKFSIRDTKN